MTARERTPSLVKTVVQNCHHFQKSTQSTLWGEGQWPLYAFFNVDYDALHFHTGSLKINIFKVIFWEGGRGSQKSTLCMLFIMLIILDDS